MLLPLVAKHSLLAGFGTVRFDPSRGMIPPSCERFFDWAGSYFLIPPPQGWPRWLVIGPLDNPEGMVSEGAEAEDPLTLPSDFPEVGPPRSFANMPWPPVAPLRVAPPLAGMPWPSGVSATVTTAPFAEPADLAEEADIAAAIAESLRDHPMIMPGPRLYRDCQWGAGAGPSRAIKPEQ